DSPTCPNFGQPARVRRCEECILMKFVPPERRAAVVPCHHIPLNEAAMTIESLAPREDDILEDSLKEWLRSTICLMEEERSQLLVAQPNELSEAHQRGPSRKRLLIVDNDELLLIALEAILRGESYEVVSGRGEEEAFHLLHRKSPDLILWGADLSEDASKETLRMLRKFRTVAPDTPMVVMHRAGVRDDSVVRSPCLASCSFV